MNHFDSAKQDKDQSLINLCAGLTVNLGMIKGECQELFIWILKRLGRYLSQATVLMPKSFKFSIESTPFLQEVKRLKNIQSNFNEQMQRKLTLVDGYTLNHEKVQMPGWIKYAPEGLIMEDNVFLVKNSVKRRIVQCLSAEADEGLFQPIVRDGFLYSRKEMVGEVKKKRIKRN